MCRGGYGRVGGRCRVRCARGCCLCCPLFAVQSQNRFGFSRLPCNVDKNGPNIVHRILVPVAATPGREAAATNNTQPLLRHSLVIS